MRSVKAEFARFLASGAANTIFSYALYVILLRVMSYAMAYTCACAAGIALSYVLNARFVFRSPVSLASAGSYPLVYLVQYVVALGLLRGLVGTCGVDARLAPLVVVVVTVPLTYQLTRWVIAGTPSPRAGAA